jgi:hypothetical protein
MLLSETVWRELTEIGLLEGDEACALCAERPLILLDVARAPILLCVAHATEVVRQLQMDLEQGLHFSQGASG